MVSSGMSGDVPVTAEDVEAYRGDGVVCLGGIIAPLWLDLATLAEVVAEVRAGRLKARGSRAAYV